MLTDRVSNSGPLTYETGVLPIALRGPPGSRLVDGKTLFKCEQGSNAHSLSLSPTHCPR